MGCVVNGPGEMPEKGYGVVGSGPGRLAFYKDRKMIPGMGTISEDEVIEVFVDQLKDDGVWVDPPSDVYQQAE